MCTHFSSNPCVREGRGLKPSGNGVWERRTYGNGKLEGRWCDQNDREQICN
jgi:hypothetical protein